MLRPWIGRFVAAASMSILATAACGDERPGNLWDTTSQMSMTGMSMPAQKMQLCTAKEWTEPPPPPPGQSCTTTDFQKTDNKVTWKTQCTGEMDMTGEGEITFNTEDSYSGVIKFVADGMSVNVALTGTKIGECDNPVG
jgi:Protein of unknown function (DUF3617)